jgi:hypothetical protein
VRSIVTLHPILDVAAYVIDFPYVDQVNPLYQFGEMYQYGDDIELDSCVLKTGLDKRIFEYTIQFPPPFGQQVKSE